MHMVFSQQLHNLQGHLDVFIVCCPLHLLATGPRAHSLASSCTCTMSIFIASNHARGLLPGVECSRQYTAARHWTGDRQMST